MLLISGVQIGTLYKLFGKTETSGYYNTITLEADEISSC